MSSTCRFVVLSVVALLAGTPAAFGQIPAVVYSGIGDQVAFVRVDSVLAPDGRIDSALVSPHDAEVIRAYMSLPPENGCVRLRGVMRDFVNTGPFTSTKDATQEAGLVFKAVVSAQAQGFMGSEAGTLLELDIEETLKGSHSKGISYYYVFFPIANFELAGRSYCAFNPDWPALPKIGDRLLLFIRNQIPSSHYLPLLDGTDIIVLSNSGPDLPPSYKAERAMKGLTSASIIEKVRAYIQEEKRR